MTMRQKPERVLASAQGIASNGVVTVVSTQ
jgi:hypothetical protein